MKNSIFVFVLFLFQIHFVNGQITKKSIDSIWIIANDGNAYTEKGSKEILRLSTEVYYQSKNIHYDIGKLRALTKMSEVYMNEQNYRESLLKLKEGINLAENIKDYITLSSLIVLQSKIDNELGYYKKAKLNLEQALRNADKITNQDKKHLCKASIYDQIADNIDFEDVTENNFEKKKIVLSYLLKAYNETSKVNSHFPNKNIYLSRTAMDVASGYFYQNNIIEAEKYLNEFHQVMGKNVGADFLPYYRTRGEIENVKKNYYKAIEYFNKGIQLYYIYKVLPSELIGCYSGLAESYNGLQDYKNKSLYLEKTKKITDSISLAEKKVINTISSTHDKVKNGSNNFYPFIILSILLILLVTIYLFSVQQKKSLAKTSNMLPEIPDVQMQDTKLHEKNETEIHSLKELIKLAQNNDKSFSIKFLELFPEFYQTSIDKFSTYSFRFRILRINKIEIPN